MNFNVFLYMVFFLFSSSSFSNCMLHSIRFFVQFLPFFVWIFLFLFFRTLSTHTLSFSLSLSFSLTSCLSVSISITSCHFPVTPFLFPTTLSFLAYLPAWPRSVFLPAWSCTSIYTLWGTKRHSLTPRILKTSDFFFSLSHSG